MPQNGIYHEGIHALADAFSHNPNLKCLNLNDNTVMPLGAEALKNALLNLKNLQVLDLGDCLLKTKGAVSIAEGLAKGHDGLEVCCALLY